MTFKKASLNFLLLLLFALGSNECWAESTSILKSLPADMTRLGFSLTESEVNGQQVFHLGVPAPMASFSSGLTKAGTYLPGAFTSKDFKYDNSGDKVTISLSTTNGETVEYMINKKDHTISWQSSLNGVVTSPSQTLPYIRDKSAVSYIENQMKDSRGRTSDQEAAATKLTWNDDKKTLLISEQKNGSLLQRQVAYHIPQGIRIQVLQNRYLVLTDELGHGFRTAQGPKQERASSVVIDVQQSLSHVQDRHDCVGGGTQSFAVASGGDGTAIRVQGSLESVIDKVMAQVREDDADEHQEKTRDGYIRLKSTSGDSSLFVKDGTQGSANPEIVQGSGWSPICSVQVTASGDKNTLDVTEFDGAHPKWAVDVDSKNDSYSAKAQSVDQAR